MIDTEIAALEGALRAAQLSADVDALDRLIGDGLLFTGPTGELATKAEVLAAHRDGVVRFVSHEPEELRLRRIGGNVAVVALRARLVVVFDGATHAGTYRYTRVWAREDDGPWRVVAGHVSAVTNAAAAEGAAGTTD